MSSHRYSLYDTRVERSRWNVNISHQWACTDRGITTPDPLYFFPLIPWCSYHGLLHFTRGRTYNRLHYLSRCSSSVAVLMIMASRLRKGKGKGNVGLYSAPSRTPLMRSDMVHTVLPANNTISAFIRKHSPGGATTHTRIANAWVQLTTHLSTARG